MSNPRNPERGGVSPWFILFLLPLALLVGWALGRVDTPKPKPAENAALEGGTAQVGGAPGAPAGQVSQWTTYDEAMNESRYSGKPIMLDFNAEWCGPCQALKREVFDDFKRGQAVRSMVIPVSITDRTREEGRNPAQTDELQARYEVDAFPTLVVFSPATGRMQQTKGYGGGDASLRWIQEAAKSVK
jgi:thiol:disulfide interchange protein